MKKRTTGFINFPLLLILMSIAGVYYLNENGYFNNAPAAVAANGLKPIAVENNTEASAESADVTPTQPQPKPYFRTSLNDNQEFTISKKTEADIKIMDMIERHQEQEAVNARYQAQLDQESEPVNMSVIPTVNYGV